MKLCVDELRDLLNRFPDDAMTQTAPDGFLQIVSDDGELLGEIDIRRDT